LNVASATGENPGDPDDEDEVEVPSDQNPAITTNKTADKETVSEAGEEITYTITVTNTGNVTLEDYTVTDVLFPEWSASIETLSPFSIRSLQLPSSTLFPYTTLFRSLNVASATGENPGDPDDEDEV